MQETRFDPWVGKIPWRRKWQPTPGFLSGESPGTQEPGRLQSMEWQRVGHDLAFKQQQVPWNISSEKHFPRKGCLDIMGEVSKHIFLLDSQLTLLVKVKISLGKVLCLKNEQ